MPAHFGSPLLWKQDYLSGVPNAALLLGFGSSSYPATTAAAGMNFGTFYTKSTAATGADTRGIYWRHYLAGASGSGEAGRFYTTVTAAGAVAAHGVHNSVSFSGSGALTGQAAANRATLQVPNSSLAGTSAAYYAELYAEGSSSAIGGNSSFFRAVFAGNATGAAAIEDTAALFRIEGGTIATGNMVVAKSSAAVTHVIRINLYGTPYYLMVSDAI